jgi:hypothetical protein
MASGTGRESQLNLALPGSKYMIAGRSVHTDNRSELLCFSRTGASGGHYRFQESSRLYLILISYNVSMMDLSDGFYHFDLSKQAKKICMMVVPWENTSMNNYPKASRSLQMFPKLNGVTI